MGIGAPAAFVLVFVIGVIPSMLVTFAGGFLVALVVPGASLDARFRVVTKWLPLAQLFITVFWLEFVLYGPTEARAPLALCLVWGGLGSLGTYGIGRLVRRKGDSAT